MERTFEDKYEEKFTTSAEREIKFIEAMEAAGIPWLVYSGRGMFGRKCPSAYTSRSDGEEVYEDDIILAAGNAGVKRLARDSMGLGTVLYTG
jgi:hypothetical protein